MQFLIDENVRKEVIGFLKSSGHDVLTVEPGLDDERIGQIAKETKRIILTHDQHFADILAYPPEEYSGIIRIKIHPPSAPIITAALSGLFQKLSPEQFNKKLIVLEEERFRIR